MSDTPERDPLEDVEKAFDEFADATEQSLVRMQSEIRTFRAEMEQARTEQRSAPVIVPPEPIDIDGIATRAASLVPVPTVDDFDIDKLAQRAAEKIIGIVNSNLPVPKDGKDAPPVNVEEIVARVAELAITRITALIPPPLKGEQGEPGERGEDGAGAPDEIRAIAREEVLSQQRDFYKGVYKEGDDYKRADAVTWNGSLWFATRDTNAKPETDDSWRLAVKRGRDGRDGKK